MRRAILFQLFLFCFLMAGRAALGDFLNTDVPEDLMPAGSALEDPEGTWTVSGGGSDIWGTSDEFHYLYESEPVGGDFAIQCHVESLDWGTNNWCKAGIMARSAAQGAIPLFSGPESYVFCCTTSGNGTCLQWRDGEGMNATWSGNSLAMGPEDVYLKLVREGEMFSGYVAPASGLWIPLPPGAPGQTIFDFEERDVYVGLAVTSHEPGVLATCEFDNLDLDSAFLSHEGPSELVYELNGSVVELFWLNNNEYEEIKLYREDSEGNLTRIEPGPEAGDESFKDEPGQGVWTYWITAVEEELECVAERSQPVFVGGEEGTYGSEVFQDRPIAYWRFGETGGFTAKNIGGLGPSVNGSYVGGVRIMEDSLLPNGENTSLFLDGVSGEVQVPDSGGINTGGPYDARSVELWFQADMIGLTPGVLFEEGGNTRGLNVYVQEVEGEARLYFNGWNMNEGEGWWDPLSVFTPIEEGEIYHAVMVFDSSENEMYGDFDGRITGYLNGKEFDTAVGADRLFAHSNNTAIGGIDNNTRFHDSSTSGDGSNFTGYIDEAALYDYALDDPDGDGDFEDSRVEAHYSAAGASGGPVFLRGDTNADGELDISDAIFLLNALFLGTTNPLCPDTADANDDGRLDIADAISILGYTLGGGPALPEPFLICGPDPEEDDLGECNYPEEVCP